ncbi:hypothetical protein ABPG72_002140 [Tetrahymena utriculariae]
MAEDSGDEIELQMKDQNEVSDGKNYLEPNGQEEDLLFKKNKNKKKSSSIFSKLYNCLSGNTQHEGNRKIYLDGNSVPKINVQNVVRNQKYNIFTFIPCVLYNQFKFFFNFFYLLICISQFIPALTVGFLFTYIAPLAFVLILTMIKDAYDDYKRYKRDKEANSSLYEVIVKGQIKLIPSMNLKVGQIVKVNLKQRIPADLIILTASEPNGTVFIRTDQLDGETDWKIRKCIRHTQNEVDFQNAVNLQKLGGLVVINQPQENIYEFSGLYKFNDHQEPLNLENTLWCNTILASGHIWGLVIHTGKETRMAMNSRHPRSKFGLFDEEVNQLSKILFYFMLILSFVMILFYGFTSLWLIQYFRYLLLLSSIIPISLRVNNDFAKAVFSYQIQNDSSIEGTVARNSNIPEELGRIQYVLADKTGTLTQNDMIFKKIIISEKQYTEEDFNEIRSILSKHCQKHKGPLSDIDGDTIAENKRHLRRKNDYLLRDAITALAVCHNVTPVIEDGETVLQASSPDEHALVKFAQSLNITLLSRDEQKVVVRNAAKEEEHFEILACFPFSSETKRMGILVRHQKTNKIIYYLKGADAIMVTRVRKVYHPLINDDCDNLAREGLRTLVVAQKLISEEFYKEWKIKYQKAQEHMQNRNAKVREVAELLEVDMELLAVTGVEDKLQDEVCSTIESMRQGGIKIWMLTGDKVETAKCIAISAGLQSRNQEIYEIKDETDEMAIRELINKFSHKSDCVLLIDGVSLARVIQSCSKIFFETACQAPAVICCRCAPKQKAEVTEMLKKYSKKRVLCIGDGGNDVGMIQCAHVGVGIVGKEGKQAALASDFSILEFKHVKQLLFWHGRNSYKKATTLSLFVIHRGLIISIIQFVFSCVFYFVAIPIYNGMLMLGYSTFYTSLPVFCLIFDQDISQKMVQQYPQLYKTLQRNKRMSTKSILVWIWISIYQGALIMLMTLTMFKEAFLNIVTITFTSLIFIELLNVYSQIHTFHFAMVVSQVFTFLLYLLSILFLNNYIDTAQINIHFFVKVSLICLCTWLPVHTFKIIQQACYPSEEKKIMRQVFTLKDFLGVLIGFVSLLIFLFLYTN